MLNGQETVKQAGNEMYVGVGSEDDLRPDWV